MRRLSLGDFIDRAGSIHGTLYDYSKVNYHTNKQPVCIICEKHGEFYQTPNSHLDGHGCNACAIEYRAMIEAHTIKEFTEKAQVVHNSYYSYSNLVYVNVHTKGTITCPIHGDFTQMLYSHLAGIGCPECAKRKAGNSRTYFRGVKTLLYVIEVAPKIYKVGITSKLSVEARYKHKIFNPYSIVFLTSFFDGEDAFNVERLTIEQMVGHGYTGSPVLKSVKNTEVFVENPTNTVIKIIKELHAKNRVTTDRNP